MYVRAPSFPLFSYFFSFFLLLQVFLLPLQPISILFDYHPNHLHCRKCISEMDNDDSIINCWVWLIRCTNSVKEILSSLRLSYFSFPFILFICSILFYPVLFSILFCFRFLLYSFLYPFSIMFFSIFFFDSALLFPFSFVLFYLRFLLFLSPFSILLFSISVFFSIFFSPFLFG